MMTTMKNLKLDLTFSNMPASYSIDRPGWMSDFIYNAIKGEKITCKFSPIEKRLLRKPKHQKPSKWVPENVYIPVGPYRSSKFRASYAPHTLEVMDAAFMPSVRHVYLCWAGQCFKSAVSSACLQYSYVFQPGPVLELHPTQTMSTENCVDKMQAAIDMSPLLRKYKTGSDKDFTNNKIRLKHITHFFAHSGSKATTSDRTIKFIKADEVDKLQVRSAKGETKIIDYLLIRTRRYSKVYKMFLCCTPGVEQGLIWVWFQKGEVYDYHVRCPYCGEYQLMELDNIKWPKGDDGHSLPYQEILKENLAWYECIKCKSAWSDHKKDEAAEHGRWFHRKTGIPMLKHIEMYNVREISPHMPSLAAKEVSLSEVAADFLKTVQLKAIEDINEAVKHLYNAHLSLPYTPLYVNITEKRLLRLKDNRPFGLVPYDKDICLCTMTVDHQDHGAFYVEVRAVSFGLEFTSYQILHLYTENIKDLDKLLYAKYYDKDGLVYYNHLCIIDSGGHDTEGVYNWARERVGRVIAYKGALGRQRTPVTYSKIDTYPDGTLIPGGLRLMRGDKHWAKDSLARRLRHRERDEPGSWNLCAETDNDYIAHLQNYGLGPDNLWKGKKNKRYDYHDTGSMQVLAWHILRAKIIAKGVK